MGHFDEVCLLCGISPVPPSELTPDPEGTTNALVGSLLKAFPDILSEVDGELASEENLHTFLLDIIEDADLEPGDLQQCGRAFCTCIAVGYFDDDGAVPRELADDPITKYRIPDGRFVTTRVVDDPSCGEFRSEVIRRTNNVGEVVSEEADRMSRTGAYWQDGFGNFFLSECCYLYLEAWIDRARLPPMWDARVLSFEGELYEIINSRETGRVDGWLEWLEPGGPEQTLEQTQSWLATESVYPAATTEGLRNGLNREELALCIYDDYGYWMFAPPHKWPRVRDPEGLTKPINLGFDAPPLASESSSPIGALARCSTEVLVQIFGWLPDLATYLGLKAVSKRLYDIVADAKFTVMVLREMLEPDMARAMFWIHPIKQQPGEGEDFIEALRTWAPAAQEQSCVKYILSTPRFPLISFIHAMYSQGSPRNRRRLWNNIKRLEDVWV
ncbi:hypothetical protein P691DRAFT_730601, partial [Macrolepiota fuliginosa MF-IS2]